MQTFVVYKHTSPTNKVYICITSKKKPEYRWNNGKGYKNNKFFYNAIVKHGWNNFTHEILFSELSLSEACEKEIELIAKYKSNNPEFGYNFTLGGEGKLGFTHSEETRKKIGESNKGKFVSAETKLKMKEKRKLQIRPKGIDNKICKKVLCVDTNETYISIKDAFEKTGIRHISECCSGRRKTAGGYTWVYAKGVC